MRLRHLLTATVLCLAPSLTNAAEMRPGCLTTLQADGAPPKAAEVFCDCLETKFKAKLDSGQMNLVADHFAKGNGRPDQLAAALNLADKDFVSNAGGECRDMARATMGGGGAR